MHERFQWSGTSYAVDTRSIKCQRQTRLKNKALKGGNSANSAEISGSALLRCLEISELRHRKRFHPHASMLTQSDRKRAREKQWSFENRAAPCKNRRPGLGYAKTDQKVIWKKQVSFSLLRLS